MSNYLARPQSIGGITARKSFPSPGFSADELGLQSQRFPKFGVRSETSSTHIEPNDSPPQVSPDSQEPLVEPFPFLPNVSSPHPPVACGRRPIRCGLQPPEADDGDYREGSTPQPHRGGDRQRQAPTGDAGEDQLRGGRRDHRPASERGATRAQGRLARPSAARPLCRGPPQPRGQPEVITGRPADRRGQRPEGRS